MLSIWRTLRLLHAFTSPHSHVINWQSSISVLAFTIQDKQLFIIAFHISIDDFVGNSLIFVIIFLGFAAETTPISQFSSQGY